MIRTVWFFIFFVCSTVLLSSSAIVLGFFPNRRLGATIGYLWGSAAVWAMDLKMDVDLSELPKEGYPVIAANHQSYVDIFILYALLYKHNISFMAKQSLFKIPLFGRAMYACGAIPIDRSNRRRAMKSVEGAVKYAQEGNSVVVFPEGTRNLDYQTRLGEFKPGGIILALKAEKPIAPVVIVGTAETMPKNTWKLGPAPRKIIVRALPPVPAGKYSLKEREQFKTDLYQQMNDKYLEMRKIWNS